MFLSLTGACGVMLKCNLVSIFCGDESIVAEDGTELSIWCMPCTSAANCGVSSKRCTKCYRYGPCPRWADLVQEMGRVNRLLNAQPGENSYHMYINVPTFLSMWIRTQRQPTKELRSRHQSQLIDQLTAFICPTECYHSAIEEQFENPETYSNRGSCGGMCSYCNQTNGDCCGPVSKERLIGALNANIFSRASVQADQLVSFITDKAHKNRLSRSIWGASAKVPAGKIHGLVLKLILSNLIDLRLATSDLAGTDKIKMKDVVVSLSKVTLSGGDGVSYDDLAINVPEMWKHFKFIEH